MSKLIPFSTIGGPRIWVSPDHVIMISDAGAGRAIVKLAGDDAQFMASGGADHLAEEVNRHRSAS